MNRRMAAKFLGFDALKGLGEAISSSDEVYLEPTSLSDEDLYNMDITLIRAYREKRPIIIKQYKRGRVIIHSGLIDSIDMIGHEIVLAGKKRIAFESVIYLANLNE